MRWPFVAFVVSLVACGGKAVVDRTSSGAGGTMTGGSGTTTSSTTTTGGNGIGGSGGSLPTDGGTDECSLCSPPGTSDQPAYNFNSCTPPLQIGCPAVECTPGVTDCGEGYTCDEWGAAACCWCQAAVPACVFTGPAQGPLPEYLKISPTSGLAGQELTLHIEGFPFYVGALYYLVRVGDSGDLFQGGDTMCSFTVTVPGQPDGMVPVWVSQYGGVEPWVLAGFFDWYTTGYPEACNQPGYPCSADMGPCCQTQDVPMACIEGRCRRL
jgi:hypothetical protein